MIRIKPTHVGLLHKNMGIAQNKPIPVNAMRKKMKSASPEVKKQLIFAMNARHWNRK